MKTTMRRPVARTGSIVVALGLLIGIAVHAHEVPSDITVQAFVRPEGRALRLIIRVPLEAMRDIDFPTRGTAGYLDLVRVEGALRDAAGLWLAANIDLYEDGRRLGPPALSALRVSLPSDRAFDSWERALAHVTGPALPHDTNLVWRQALFDALLEYPIASDESAFAVEPRFSRLGLRVVNAIRVVQPGRPVRAFEFAGDAGLVQLDPHWHQAARRFVDLGFRHILDGADHLLFLACLIVPLRRLRPLLLVVTSFTLAHSITLVASAFDLAPAALWFPVLVETLIALSILWMALENIIGRDGSRRWIAAFGFGLVHGFGFSFALRETLQFSGGHLVTSLLAFNVGVELGQVAVLVVLAPILNLVMARAMPGRVGVIVLSALIAHTGLHWTLERFGQLRAFPWAWPVLDAALAASTLRWAMLAVLLAGVLWMMAGVARRLAHAPPDPADTAPAP